MSEKKPPIGDQILDLLLDALLQRQQEREREGPAASLDELKSRAIKRMREQEALATPSRLPTSDQDTEPEPADMEPPRPEEALPPPAAVPAGLPVEEPAAEAAAEEPEGMAPLPDEAQSAPQELPSVHLYRLMGRLSLALLVLIVIINIPFNRYGTSLARAMPDSASLIIRDGLLLKGSGEKVYVLEDNKRRWITTLDAFVEYGYRWSQVHQVEDSFLADFEEGLPIHLLLKCETSPHIYALEDGQKRWIKDIPTFEAQQYVWEDVRFVSCRHLRNLPDGPPIPEDAGPPPQP